MIQITEVKTASRMLCRIGGAAALLLAAGAAAEAQEAVVKSLAGAWVQEGTSCAEVFSWKGGRASYKKPIDAFAPAFLVTGQQIQGPQASCRVISTKPLNDRTILILGCATSVALGRTEAAIRLDSGGNVLERYMSLTDPLAERYTRCTP
jgi:hypothetical protein